MLKDKVVMACFNIRDEIEEIAKGDFVFLFQNKVGIVAIGKASGVCKIVDFEKVEDGGMIQKLRGFTRLKTPIRASTITAVLRNFDGYEKGVFLKTRVEIPAISGSALKAIGEVAS
jgi:hypothetical protein